VVGIAVSAVYLAMRGRGAVLSIALSSNAINVVAGLLIPGSITGLGPASGQDILVAAWYAGLTVLALAFAYHGRGLTRLPGALIIAGCLAFVAALCAAVAHGGVYPAAAIVPAAVIALPAAALLARPGTRSWRRDLPGLPHLILTGLLICGPCCALLAAQRPLTAVTGGFAVALSIVLGVPDQIFATTTQYALVAAVAVAGAASTTCSAVLQRPHS
jgi:hypothetical protein